MVALFCEIFGLDEALTEARKITNEHVRVNVLASLAKNADDEWSLKVRTEAWETALHIEGDILKSSALQSLVRNFPNDADLLEQIREAADLITSGAYRAEALAPTAAQMGHRDRVAFLARVLTLIPDTGQDMELGEALQAVARESVGMPDILKKIVLAASHLSTSSWRSVVLRTVAWRLSSDFTEARYEQTTWDAQSQYEVFGLLVDAATDLARPDWFTVLAPLTPAIAVLGGSEAVGESVDAIADVGRWWA